MDALGLLLAVAAVTVYPGGIHLAAVAWSAGWWSPMELRTGSRYRLDWSSAVAGGLIVVAAALLPLPGSPAAALPPGAGATPNLVALLLLLAAALVATLVPTWTRAQAICGAACTAPLLVLASATSTLALPTLAALPGEPIGAARIAAGLCLLLAAPVLARQEGAGAPGARGLLACCLVLLGLGLFVPAALSAQPPWSVAVVVALAATLHGRFTRRLAGSWQQGLLALATVLSASLAIGLAVLSAA